jgi:hypothetical protein
MTDLPEMAGGSPSPIEKAKGVTESERYLSRLCHHSFLSMWSYPGIFRDQGKIGGKGDGKELCDLLVVFGKRHQDQCRQIRPRPPYEDFWRNAIDANGFQILHILPRHTTLLTTMPYHHRDPFDRLIIAQALAEGMSLVSTDSIIDAYSVARIW